MKRLFTRIVAAALIACSLSFAPAARAASMTDYLENLVIDYIFRGQAFAAPTVLAIGLPASTSHRPPKTRASR